MGCDIHFYVERRVNGGKWVTADAWQPASPEDGDPVPHVSEHYYGDRNYDLFAMLTNVRNGHGFAGVKTGEGFVPISDPRGVPEDACPEYRAAVESWGDDGHSHSHLTVRELMEYDWTQTTHLQGCVTRKQYARFKTKGSPDSWSGGVMGGGVQHLSNAEMEALDLDEHGKYNPWAQFHAPENITAVSVYTLVSWEVPYYRAGSAFLSEVLPRLWRLGSPDDVRCVFFFDN